MTQYRDLSFPRKSLNLDCTTDSDEELAKKSAELFIDPVVAATRIICVSEDKSGLARVLDVPSLASVVREQVSQGKIILKDQIDEFLLSYSVSLQAIFVRLTEKGMQSQDPLIAQSWLKLALRAQNQCRVSLEALSVLRSPSIVYAKRANIAAGPQQVNHLNRAMIRSGKKFIKKSNYQEN